MLSGPDAFTKVALRLVDAVQAALDPPAGRSGLVPGTEIAWDACDCDGQLAVAITRAYPSRSFPAETTGGGPCEVPYQVAELTVQLARCTPVPDDRGNPPGDDALTASTVQFELDRWASWQAIRRDLNQLKRLGDQPGDGIDDWAWRETIMVGPDGGCAAVSHQLAVALLTECP